MDKEVESKSIAARIATLKLDQVYGSRASPKSPGQDVAQLATPRPKVPPPPPPAKRPNSLSRAQTTQSGVYEGHGAGQIGNQAAVADPVVRGSQAPVSSNSVTRTGAVVARQTSIQTPALPARPGNGSKGPPPLPARSAMDQKDRISKEMIDFSRIKAPIYDPAAIPPLPTRTSRSLDSRPSLAETSTHSSPAVPQKNGVEVRTSCSTRKEPLPAAAVSPPEAGKIPKRSALSLGFGDIRRSPQNPSGTAENHTPPPIPKISKPRMSDTRPAETSISTPATTGQTACLHCREFSVADAHAARFPRHSIPSSDIGWLAQQLTAPFSSLTDRARVIFAWLHHNIDYDTHALYTNSIKPSTPSSTLSSGLAVCEGYAGLFNALAIKAGLESIVIGGHGKGVGYAALTPESALPRFDANHAWNAVRIDGGRWKLIDACWGAGSVSGNGQPYVRRYSPDHFTRDNTEFGLSHFPSDASHQHREDGHRLSWEQYMLSDLQGGPHKFGGFIEEEGVSRTSFKPSSPALSLGAFKDGLRVQFNRVCEHWDPARNGQGLPYCYILETDTGNGQTKRTPFEHNGVFWWADIASAELGVAAAGQKVKIAAVTHFDGKDGRGVTSDMFRDKNGKVGMGWGYVASWDVNV